MTRVKQFLILTGLVVRELFAFWTGHPYDFEIWVRVGYYVARGFNPYTYLYYIKGVSFSPYEALTSIGYPPPWALICGFSYIIYQVISNTISIKSATLYYFLTKQPIIFGDILNGIIITKLFIQEEPKIKMLKFWMLNPLIIILSSIWGIFDSLVFALSLLSIKYLILDKKEAISGVFLGIASSFKLIPLIFVPINLKLANKKVHFILSYSASMFIFAVLPFLIFGWSYTGFYNAMSSQAFNIREIPAVGGMTIFSILEYASYFAIGTHLKTFVEFLSYVWLISFSIFYMFLYFKYKQKMCFDDAIRLYIIVTLLFILTRVFIAEQYALYLLGLMVIDIAIFNPERKSLFNTICVLALTYLIINNTLLIRFLSPVTSWAFSWDINFNNSPPSETIRHIFRVFIGFLFYVSVLQSLCVYLKKEKYVIPWINRILKDGLSFRSIKYFIYLLLVIFNILLLDYIIVNMISDWGLVLTKTFILGLPLFSLYHLMLILLVTGFDIIICLFMNEDLGKRIKTFARLMILNLLATAMIQPIFQILRGKTPLIGEPNFVVCFQLDERVFVAYSVIGAIIGLFVFEGLFDELEKILKQIRVQRLKMPINGVKL